MKKISTLLLLFTLFNFFVFSESYKISDVEYSVEGAGFKFLGATKPSSLRKNFPIDKKKIFDSREALDNYINNFEKSLISSRDFDTVEVDYEISLSENENDEPNNVIIKVSLVDSHHLIVVPYPKYSSEGGASLRLKARDSNFLGTLNTMNTNLNLRLDDEGFKPGISFDFDYPFDIGKISATFINDYSLSYIVAEDEDKRGFEWDTKTGLSLSLPFEHLPLNIGIYQYTGGDLDYRYYENDESSWKFKDNEDYYFFSEELSLGTSFALKEFSNYTSLSYSPSIGIKWHWDFDGINKANDGLSSPTVTFSHSLSNGKVNWNDNMRKGYSLSLSNTFSYNFHRHDLNPSITFNGQFFWNYQANDQDYWNRYGICSKVRAFYYFEVPSNQYQKRYSSSFDDDLRGVWGKNCRSYPMGFVLNLDLPHNVFTSEFDTQIINFNLQMSPFFDMALAYDKSCDRPFNLYDDGYYSAGLEFLVYPLKWSSITVRASLGVDLKGAAKDDNFLQAISNNKEIFIGIGLQY